MDVHGNVTGDSLASSWLPDADLIQVLALEILLLRLDEEPVLGPVLDALVSQLDFHAHVD